MFRSVTRRDFLTTTAAGLSTSRLRLAAAPAPAPSTSVPDMFPTQPPELVREVVLVSHFNLQRLRELVDARPSLARASWDWGFGDWESALGAASHMGNRAIAEYLLERGARPTLFSATMLGQLEVVKAFVAAQPGVQRIPGPHSISLLAHAKAGGDRALPVLQYLESLGDAGAPPAAPLSGDDMSALTGTYVYGPGATEQIDITVDKNQMVFTRKGTIGRGLIHLGDRVFHPIGAAAVRIKFADGALTIHDPEPVLTATKTAAHDRP